MWPKLSVLLALAGCLFAPGLVRATPIVFGVQFTTNGEAGTVDVATGSFTIVGSVGPHQINDVAYSPGGAIYAIADEDELVTINPATGALTAVMPVPGFETLVFRPSNGTLFAATTGALFTINLANQTYTEIGNYGSAIGNNAQNIRFDQAGNLYTTDTGTPTDVFLISTSTGQATFDFSVPFGALSLGFAGDKLYGVGIPLIGGSGNLVWIDPLTKTGTETLASFPGVDFSQAPEPAAVGLCGLGLAALAVCRRRRP